VVRHVVVLGAGISGLATAWFLKKKLGASVSLTIVEKSPRVGGWIQTQQKEEFLFEQGPRSCRSSGTGRQTLELVEALGLQNQIIGAHPSARKRFLFCEQQLQPLPRHLLTLPFSSLMKGWKASLWRDWSASGGEKEDESIYSFFSRHLNPKWIDRFIDPFVSGIYAGDIHKLSIKSCFPLFAEWEQKHGSLLKGAWYHPKRSPPPTSFVSEWEKTSLFSFKGGMQVLPKTIAKQLEGNIRFNCSGQSINKQEEGILIKLDNGEELKADHVIAALPAEALACLFTSHHNSIATSLHSLSTATVCVVNLGYRKNVLKRQGFGYLIPFQEGESILGCVWDSCVFPQQNEQADITGLTIMMGGTQHPEIGEWPETQILQVACSALERHLGIKVPPDIFSIKWARHAIPQYEVGHRTLIFRLKKQMNDWPHLTLTGPFFHGVSVNDCIAEAHQLAQRLMSEWKG
jgi:protoporphyrinogen/coproporphyrinogen III oxidase